jgi:opacity protein-like surface antigen
LTLFLAVAAAPAAAGSLGPDVFAGYSYARIDEAARHGWNAALGLSVSGPFAVFADASGHCGSEAGADRRDFTLMAGPGLRLGKAGGTVFFARVLGGLVRDRTSIPILDIDISETSTRVGVLAGGGVDLRVARTLAVRVQGDYLWKDAPDDAKPSGFRASAGLVYRFGLPR